MSNWDKKVGRIVNGTDRLLTSAKVFSAKSRLYTPSNTNFRVAGYNAARSFKSNSSLAYNGRNSCSFPPSSVRTPEGHRGSSLVAGLVSPPKRSVRFEAESVPCPECPTSLTILSERIKDQQKDLNALRESVNRLHSYMTEHQDQTRSLKEELHITMLAAQKEGCGLKADRKLQKWKQELTNEIDQLKLNIQARPPGVANSSPVLLKSFSSLTNTIYENKLQTDHRLSDLQKELISMKAELAYQGSRVSEVARDVKHLEKEHKRTTTKAMCEVYGHHKDDMIGGRHIHTADLNSDLRKLRHLMSSFELRLMSLEEVNVLSATNHNHVHGGLPNLPTPASTSVYPGILRSSHLDVPLFTSRSYHSNTATGYGKREGDRNPLQELVGGHADVVGGGGRPGKCWDDSDSLTSLDVDNDISLSIMELSDGDDSTFNDVQDFVLDSDRTLSPLNSE